MGLNRGRSMELWVNGKTLKYERLPYGGLFHFSSTVITPLCFLHKESGPQWETKMIRNKSEKTKNTGM